MSQSDHLPTDAIKSATSLPDLIGESVTLRRNGSTWTGHCPFHEERTGSLKVWADHYKCFGCGAHGDAISFVQRHQQLSFRDAVALLAERAGISLDPPSRAAARRAAEARREAASIAQEAAELWCLHRRSLVAVETRLGRLERAAERASAPGQPLGQRERAWPIFVRLAERIRAVRERIAALDAMPGEVLAAAYLDVRTPALSRELRSGMLERERDGRALGEALVELIAMGEEAAK